MFLGNPELFRYRIHIEMLKTIVLLIILTVHECESIEKMLRLCLFFGVRYSHVCGYIYNIYGFVAIL
jgi:hypothetical protein